MPEKYMSLIQRQGHSAATFTVNSDCVEVILVGGCDRNYSLIADTTILRFGELESTMRQLIQCSQRSFLYFYFWCICALELFMFSYEIIVVSVSILSMFSPPIVQLKFCERSTMK